MICVITICALLAGGGPMQCDMAPGSTMLVEIGRITTAAGCKQVADDIRSGALPLPAGLRFVRRDMMPPKQPETQDTKR